MTAGKILCSIGLHRYMHVVEEWEYMIRLEFVGAGFQHFHKVCRCGHRVKIEKPDKCRLPLIAAPVYSYIHR